MPSRRAPERLSRRVVAATDHARVELVPEHGRPWRVLLRLDGEDAAHVDLADPSQLHWAYLRRLGDVADLAAAPGRPITAVHVGGGAFALPRYVAHTRPGSRQEVAEIDAGLTALARTHLGLDRLRGVRVRAADGLEVLRRRRADEADVVLLDAFVGTTIPPHLVTRAALGEAARALRPGGLFAANVIDDPPLPVARALAATARAVFADVAVLAGRPVLRGRRPGNLVVVGRDRRLPRRELRTRALRGASPEILAAGEDLDAWLGGAKPSE